MKPMIHPVGRHWVRAIAAAAMGATLAMAGGSVRALEVSGTLGPVVVPYPPGLIGMAGLSFNVTPGDYLISVVGPVSIALFTPATALVSPLYTSGLPGLSSYTFSALSGAYTLDLFGAPGASYTVGILGTGTVTLVPEPQSVARAFAGLGALGFLARRRLGR
jgi:hypothetical protein